MGDAKAPELFESEDENSNLPMKHAYELARDTDRLRAIAERIEMRIEQLEAQGYVIEPPADMAQVLVRHEDNETPEHLMRKIRGEEEKTDDDEMKVRELTFPDWFRVAQASQVVNTLEDKGIFYVPEAARLSPSEMLVWYGIGPASVKALNEALRNEGLSLNGKRGGNNGNS